MNVKEAVTLAKRYIADVYAEERALNIGLEEVEFNESANEWSVTIGFSRPWDEPRNPLVAISAPLKRSYKVLRISGANGSVISIKNREAT